MSWIRLTDNYLDDEQIQALSDGAFRLWHEGIAYARRNSTDGLIPFVILRGFRSFTKGREKQIATPHRTGLDPLWMSVPGMGYRIKSYLKWNPSKDEEESERESAAARMRRLRRSSGSCSPPCSPEQTPEVLEREGLDQFREERIEQRAADLRQEHYPRWYFEERGGHLPLFPSHVEILNAKPVCRAYPDDRIERIARIVLTTDDEWIARTDRGFKIFLMKAAWANDRLTQWEREQAQKAAR